MSYKIGSLFDGSGGFPLAGSLCGIEPVWASEVEPYPIAVTRSRFPNMKHLGDISKINGAEMEPVDVITFGSPCQDLSVAGKRAGLDLNYGMSFEELQSKLGHESVNTTQIYSGKLTARRARKKTAAFCHRLYCVWRNNTHIRYLQGAENV